MIDGVVVVVVASVTADLIVVAILLLAGGEVIQDQDLVSVAGVQGQDQGIDVGVHDLATAAADLAARAMSGSPHEESPMIVRIASPGIESPAASPEAAPDPSPNLTPDPNHGADPQSSRMEMEMVVMWANRKKELEAQPGAVQAAPTDTTKAGRVILVWECVYRRVKKKLFSAFLL